jgi:hypothetical protein
VQKIKRHVAPASRDSSGYHLIRWNVDFWWAGVEQDLEQAASSVPWRTWAKECLLPVVYWEHRVAHTRCGRRKAKMRQACEAVRAVLHTHALTLRLLRKPGRLGIRGRRSKSMLFSAPPRLSKAATALWHSSITISVAYQSDGTKCGQYCITSIAVPPMGPHPLRGFSDERFQTSLKPCSPI